jgi:hypothetical protein
VTLQKYISHPRLVIYFFPISPPTQTESAKGSETTNNNLTEPIKPYSQSIAGVQFCFAFCHAFVQIVHKCCAHIILLSQTGQF